MDLSSLDATVHYFCSQGVAPSTRSTYQSALRKFAEFCSLYSIITPFPVSESILCYFSSYLACKTLSPQTIKTYLAGIRHMQITLGLPEPRAFSSLPRLRLVQSGIQRTHAQQSSSPAKIRLPITPAILRKIQEQWSAKSSDLDILMLWAAAVLCFFGFFRAGEITVPSQNSFDSKRHLSWGDVAVDNPMHPTMLRVKLKCSKTDQFGKGVEVYVGRTGCLLCPVAATLAYMASRGSQEGAFFQFKTGQPLTKAKFTQHVRTALQAAGLPYLNFAGHSFRIGAATSAARAGIEDSVIRTLGRWNSAAFLVYIRTPREHLAQFSVALVHQ